MAGNNGVWLVAVCGLLAGCAGIPERDLENAFRYQRLKRYDYHTAAPIDSEFQALADQAWAERRQGGRAEYVAILENGDDALLARIHLIRSARRSIDLQTFIWRDDASSRFVFDELVRAAERGVQVRMLIDAVNMPRSVEFLARMARAHRHIELCFYKPLAETAQVGTIGFWDSLLFKTRDLNRRMHNKLLLVDGRIGIVGGRNYDGKYFDRNPLFLFRDRDVVVAGPSAADMAESFELFWQDKHAVFVTQLTDVQAAFAAQKNGKGPFLDPADRAQFERIDREASARSIAALRETISVHEADKVTFIFDPPSKFKRDSQRMAFDEWFAAVLADADERLIYQTPYLIYSREVRALFRELHRRNPDFRIMAASNSLAAADHVSTYALSFKHRKELYKKSGIDIYEAKPFPGDRERFVPAYAELANNDSGVGPRLCIHAKSFVVDGRVSLIGSHNFDPRSSRLNTECGVFIEDEGVAAELEALILSACAPQNAWTVSKRPTVPVISYFSGFIGGISAVLPVFDVWPYRYTSNYELKPGCEPLPPRHPDFQANYADVGYFPEVPSSGTAIQARLMKAFMGWARPLM